MPLCPGGISHVYMQHEAWNVAKPLKSNRWYFFWVRPEIAIWQTHYTPLIVLMHVLCIFYTILNTITMYAFFRLWHIMLCKNYRARQATERNKFRKGQQSQQCLCFAVFELSPCCSFSIAKSGSGSLSWPYKQQHCFTDFIFTTVLLIYFLVDFYFILFSIWNKSGSKLQYLVVLILFLFFCSKSAARGNKKSQFCRH